jgi:hypothetical protein
MSWEIPYFEIEAALAGAFVLALATIHLWRAVHSELKPRTCVFCGERIDADEHPHHLEICGLMTLSLRGGGRGRAEVQIRRAALARATAPELRTADLSRGVLTALPPDSQS